jgi:hypothetical protein
MNAPAMMTIYQLFIKETHIILLILKETFVYNKEVIKGRNSKKGRYHNGQKDKQ